MIVVCGEALIDMIPTPDGTRRGVPGGGPFNTARALARLGVPTAFLGHLSTDRFGQELAGVLEADGASLRLTTFSARPTTIAVADVNGAGLTEYRFDFEGTSAPWLTPAMVPAAFDRDVTALHVGTLGLALEPMAETLEALVEREHGSRLVMVDPNVRPGLMPEDAYRERLHRVLRRSTAVKASDADLAWLYPGVEYADATQRLLDGGASMVVVTLGVDGAFGALGDHRIRVPAPHVQVVDTIGAGDAFGAALLAWLHDHDRIRPRLRLERAELKAALDFACLAAAITCGRAGADPPGKHELISA